MMFPLIKLAKKLKEKKGAAKVKSAIMFPLIKLAKKLKGNPVATMNNIITQELFPLIKLAKKLKEVFFAYDIGLGVSIN